MSINREQNKNIMIIILFTISKMIYGQEGNISQPKIISSFKLTYEQLKAYEGIYEYLNNTTLEIAASPKDTTLYAIINGSKYRLTTEGKDLFRDMTGNEVRFFRKYEKEVIGYYVGNDTLNLLSKDVQFPEEMWYPRLPIIHKYKYTYAQPKNLNDGLEPGSINKADLDLDMLSEMMDKIIGNKYQNVHSILIAKGGKLVFEEYFYEYSQEKLHELRSATKSFISALTGIAIDIGKIGSKNEKVLSFFPEYTIKNNDLNKHNITLENLLTNQSGFDCDINNPAAEGNETDMGMTDDWVKYTLDLPMIESAGGIGRYCSGNSIILGKIIENATESTLPNFANQYLFTPLGIKSFKWEFVPNKSSAQTFCQLYLTARDMVKFGMLYLNKGNYKGNQVISSDWVNQSLSSHSQVQGVDYGYLWWHKYLEVDGVKYYTYGAQGNGGQKIYIFQEYDMVIVITGGNYNAQSPSDEIIKKYIIPAI